NLGMTSCIWPECRNKVRIRKKADVKYQVSIVRHPSLVAKTHTGNQNILLALARSEFVSYVGPQLVNVEFGTVNHDVRQCANGLELPAFLGQSRPDCAFLPQRMRATRFTEATQQSFIRSFKKEHGCFELFAQRVDDGGKLLELVSLAYVHDQSGLINFR